MADCVAILPDFTFAERIHELSAFYARALPSAEQQAWAASIVDKAAAAEESKSEKEQQLVVSDVVKGVQQGTGAFEAPERDLEQAYLLLFSVVIATFASNDEASAKEYQTVIDTVVKASKAMANAGQKGLAKSEVGYRIMTNAYNLLPSTSPLRPRTLLALLSLLSADLLPSLSLSISQIEQYIFEWSISDSDRVQWLKDVAAVYETGISTSAAPSAATTTQLKEKSLELRVLALTVVAVKGLGIDASAVEKTIGAALSVPARFDISGVLSINGVRQSLQGDVKELVALLEGDGETAGDLKKATAWVESKGQWLESIGVSAAEITRKLRLLALTSLCAKSQSKDIKYADIAAGLDIPVKEVERWVIDAIASNLLQARLAQPTQSLRVQSVYSRSFGKAEWVLLEKRLGEWKTALDEVRAVVDDALKVSSGPEERKEKRQGQSVAA